MKMKIISIYTIFKFINGNLMKYLPFFFLLLLTFLSCKEETLKHTNIVFILTDDLGYGDLRCYGSKVNLTPNLDQMAAEGVKATSFLAAQAVCSASRAAFLTGCYPNRIGIHNALMPNAKIALNHNEITIAEMLKSQNYTSGIFGKWHLGDHPDYLPPAHGFDEYYGIPYSNDMWPLHPEQGSNFNFGPLPLINGIEIIDTLTDQKNLTKDLTEKSIDFINRHASSPFFLYLAHPQPHVPLFVSDDFKGKSENGLYGDVIMEIDWSVGQILHTLKTLSLDKNTLVIFTSDNGPWLSYGDHAGSAGIFREGKGTAWEGGHREPFIAWYPGHLAKGTIINEPFYAIDLLPTIAHVTGASLPDHKIDGMNVWEMLSGESVPNDQRAFYYYYKTNELHAIRYGDWKMVFPHNYRTLKGTPGGTGGVPVPYHYVNVDKPELYHLKDDPEERNNVYKDHLVIVVEIEKIAAEARRTLGDRLLNISGESNRPAANVVWSN